ncbi:C-terminal binding protein [bacterium]|nr:C-terminal binding protein [candidate division CSSED10-310 bacterium]
MSTRPIFKITDYIENNLKWEEEECTKLGVNFSCYQLKDASPETIINSVGDADIVLVNMAKMTSDVMAGLRNVKVIMRHGIGYDNVDVQAATENGIIFANEATASSIDVAEHAIMLMFATYRKINIHREILENSIGRQQYDFSKIYPLYRMEGKTLGIVGCGNIGSIVLKKMKSFGMKTLVVCDPYLSKERMMDLGISCTPLDEVLKQSDIVTIHVPLTDETHGMFNYDLFRLMKKSAVIINTSRGPIINTADLIKALKGGMIAGAGLDVLDHEPPPRDSELIKTKNVVMTPHLAWYSEEGGWDIRHMIMDDLKAFLEGKPPRFVINPEVYNNPKLRMNILY